MKKLILVTCLTCVLAFAAQAAEGQIAKKASPVAELKAARAELIKKYDTNENKRLDKTERSKMTPEDLEKWESTSPAAQKKVAAEEKEKAAAAKKAAAAEKKN
jgi:hypothetical protein